MNRSGRQSDPICRRVGPGAVFIAAFAAVAIAALTIGCVTTVTAVTGEDAEVHSGGDPEPRSRELERIDPPRVDPHLAAGPAVSLPAPSFYLDDTFERRSPADPAEPEVRLEPPKPPAQTIPTASGPAIAEAAPRSAVIPDSVAESAPPEPRRAAPPLQDSAPEAPRAAPERSRPAPDEAAPATTGSPATTEAPRTEAPLLQPSAVERSGLVPVPPDTDADDASVVMSGTRDAGFVWPTESDPRVVRPGTDISIALPGTGWLYVGKEYGDGSVTLLGRSRTGDDETFRFRIPEPGDYGLWFQRQDPLAGTFANERFVLRADPQGEQEGNRPADAQSPVRAPLDPTAAAQDRRPSPEASSADEPGPGAGALETQAQEPSSSVARAVRLLESGETADAIALLAAALAETSAVRAIDEQLARRFADAARRESVPTPVLRAFWRGLASSGVLEADANRALLDIGIREGDIDDVLDSFLRLEAAQTSGGSDPALGMPDDTLYALARRLESPGPRRDLRRALSLYRMIIDDRPLSPHWDDSRSRVEYLERHYFDVR